MPTGTCRSHTSKIEPERLAERDWFSKSQSPLLNIYFRLSGFYVSTSASVWIPVHTTQKCVARNRSDMWRSTFEIGCPVAEIAPRSPCSRVNTDALCGRVFVPAQSYPVEGEHSLSQFQALLFPTPTPVAHTTKAVAVKTSLDIVTSRCLKLPRDYSTLVHSAE